MASSVYSIGSSGTGVKDLQTKLKAVGYDTGTVDGIYGPKTQSAVLAYQKANKLTVDGIAGAQTLGSLSSTPKAPVATGTNVISPVSNALTVAQLAQQSKTPAVIPTATAPKVATPATVTAPKIATPAIVPTTISKPTAGTVTQTNYYNKLAGLNNSTINRLITEYNQNIAKGDWGNAAAQLWGIDLNLNKIGQPQIFTQYWNDPNNKMLANAANRPNLSSPTPAPTPTPTPAPKVMTSTVATPAPVPTPAPKVPASTIATPAPVPTPAPTKADWEIKLESYKTNKQAAIDEVARAKQVYADEQATYDKTNKTGTPFSQTARAKQISDWATSVRQVAGLSDTQYGASVPLNKLEQGVTPTETISKNVLPEPTYDNNAEIAAVQKKAYEIAKNSPLGWQDPGAIAAHNRAEQIRATMGYSGGAEGNQNIPVSTDTQTSALLKSIMDTISQRKQELSDFGKNFQPSETQEQYSQRRLEEIKRLTGQQETAAQGTQQKAIGDITTEQGISNRGLEETYNASQSDLASQAEKIRNAYTSGQRGIEAGKAQTMPEFQSQRSQTDIATQKASKNIIDYMTKKGLARSGEATSELAQTQGAGIGAQSDINKQESNYLRDTQNKLTGLEEQQATGLADVERLKGQASLSLASGKRNIIERVNNALAGLDIDQKNLLDKLAATKAQMESNISVEYKDMTTKEKQTAFDNMLKKLEFADKDINTVNSIIDQMNKSAQYKLEQVYKDKVLAISEAAKNNQISANEKDYLLKQAEFEWKKSGSNPANIQKSTEAKTTGQLKYSDYANLGLAKMGQVDAKGTRIYTDQSVKEWVFGLPLSAQEKYDIAKTLGVY